MSDMYGVDNAFAGAQRVGGMPVGAPVPSAGAATAAGAEMAAAPALTEAQLQELAQRDLVVSATFARIVSVLMRSARHKHHSLANLEWLIVPPLLRRGSIRNSVQAGGHGLDCDKMHAATYSRKQGLRPSGVQHDTD